MPYWGTVPGGFGLDIHVQIVSASQREVDELWRFTEGPYSTCPQHGPASRQTDTHWAELSSGMEGWDAAAKINAETPPLIEKATHH